MANDESATPSPTKSYGQNLSSVASQAAIGDPNGAAIRLSNVGNFSFGRGVLKNPSSPKTNLNEKGPVAMPGRNFGREVTPQITD